MVGPRGRLLMKNTGDKKESHPNRCVLGCGMLWTKSGCNATKQAGHIIGDDKSVKMCSKATEDDKRLAASFRTKPPSSQRLTMRLTVTGGYSKKRLPTVPRGPRSVT